MIREYGVCRDATSGPEWPAGHVHNPASQSAVGRQRRQCRRQQCRPEGGCDAAADEQVQCRPHTGVSYRPSAALRRPTAAGGRPNAAPHQNAAQPLLLACMSRYMGAPRMTTPFFSIVSSAERGLCEQFGLLAQASRKHEWWQQAAAAAAAAAAVSLPPAPGLRCLNAEAGEP